MQSDVYQGNPVYSAGSGLTLVPQHRRHDQRRGLSCRLLCCGPAGKQVEEEETAGSMFTGMEEKEKEKGKGKGKGKGAKVWNIPSWDELR